MLLTKMINKIYIIHYNKLIDRKKFTRLFFKK